MLIIHGWMVECFQFLNTYLKNLANKKILHKEAGYCHRGKEFVGVLYFYGSFLKSFYIVAKLLFQILREFGIWGCIYCKQKKYLLNKKVG